MPYSQDERIYTVLSSLGDDMLLLRRISGIETISEGFRFDLELASERADIDFASIVGSALTVEIALEGSPPRYINGIVSRFTQGVADDRFVAYRAEIVSWVQLLGHGTNCRIFQDKSVIEILELVFQGRGFTDFEDKTQGSYPPIAYCVQYRESDLCFAARLMEENGIGYYFTHDKKRHVLVLFDTPSGSEQSLQFEATCVTAEGLLRPGNVWGWSCERAIGPGACSLTDYDFEKPNTSLAVTTATVDPIGGNESFEIYDYPGRYDSVDRGEALAKLRIEAEEAAAATSTATSDCAHFAAGTYFLLLGHYRPSYNAQHLITRVSHTGEQSLRGDEPSPATYENVFTSIPYSTQWRPLRRTPKPVVHGVQTAVVVGPAGEEIYVDAHARVKVQFHWDREGKRDENSSCWIRVSQLWAGKGWGGISIPRIGQEVIVEFIEGDPDRPIITGRVYNAVQQAPFALPAGATNAGIKTRSTPGGGGYNEISMDDTKGKEGFTIHAQYDMSTTVEHDATIAVKNDRTTSVTANDTESVGGDQTESVTGNRTRTVGKDEKVTVTGLVEETIGKTLKYTVTDSITFICGASKLVMNSDGTIELNGVAISINGKAEVGVKGGVNVTTEAGAVNTVKGAMVMSEASGPNTVKGAVVMLNPGG